MFEFTFNVTYFHKGIDIYVYVFILSVSNTKNDI